MRTSMSALLAGVWVITAVGAAAPAYSSPVQLTDQTMDFVTAGATVTGTSSATTVGGIIGVVQSGVAGTTSSAPLPTGGSIESGVVLTTSSSASLGGTGTTSATTSGSTTGPAQVNTTFGYSLPGVISYSVTYVAGGPSLLSK